MGEVGIFEEKTVTSDGLLQGTGVCCLTCSEDFRYLGGEVRHQDLKEEGD